MIEEIIRLRGDGLSFRKIASELNTTVGRVQYRWSKWMNDKENEKICIDAMKKKETKSSDNQTSHANNTIKGELNAKLVSPRKMILFWEVADLPKKIIQLFFNIHFEDVVQVVRIYDVTDIIFNGKNALHLYEISVPFDNGHWYINGLMTNRSYIAELGVLLTENNFFPILRSNTIQTPMMELPEEDVVYENFMKFQQSENQPPKWIDHVSTYSYYREPKATEENNG